MAYYTQTRNTCIDCGALKKSANGLRCKPCSSKKANHKSDCQCFKCKNQRGELKGKKHSRYKDGQYCTPNYCLDCCKEIGPGIYKRCHSCAAKHFQSNPEFKKGLVERTTGANNPMWKGGKSFEPYALGWNKTFKEQVRFRDGYKCQLCGVPEIECNRKLSVHHIDYDKMNIKISNLVSLCDSCHGRTNGNRLFWTEYFKQGEE